MKAILSTSAMLLSMFLLVSPAVLSAEPAEPFVFQEDSPEEPKDPSTTRLSVSGKGALHTFWSQGVFKDGERYGRPDLTAQDLMGPALELDFSFHWRPHIVFTATAGGYQGRSNDQNMEILAFYGLGTAKLVNQTRFFDYYTGLGLGVYYADLDADGNSTATKGGMHALFGIRIPFSGKWAFLIEDRLAFSQKAGGGFQSMNLGGNFALLGVDYRF